MPVTEVVARVDPEGVTEDVRFNPVGLTDDGRLVPVWAMPEERVTALVFTVLEVGAAPVDVTVVLARVTPVLVTGVDGVVAEPSDVVFWFEACGPAVVIGFVATLVIRPGVELLLTAEYGTRFERGYDFEIPRD